MTASTQPRIDVGLVLELGSHTFERDEIIEFARQFDPQPFHLSDEGARNSHFGKLCASGWQTLSVWMRLNILNGRNELERATGLSWGPEVMGPSPGVRNIRWLLPVFVGDTVSYRSTFTGTKPSKREGWSVMMNHVEGFNQRGDKVVQMDGSVMVRVKQFEANGS